MLWRKLWGARVPGKVKICVWRGCQDGLPTHIKLAKRKVIHEVDCVFCRSILETIEHIFRDCDLASAVWFAGMGLRVRESPL